MDALRSEIESLRRELTGLSARLSAIEKAVAIPSEPTPKPAEVAALAEAIQTPISMARPVAVAAPVVARVAVPPPLPAEPDGLDRLAPRGAERSSLAARAIPVPGPSLELKLGRNVMSWVGGGVLLLGMAFFVKYAWEMGWIRPSPVARVAITAMLGAALAGAGVWASKRGLVAFPQALMCTGLAIASGAFLWGYRLVELPVLGARWMLACVLAVTVAGTALALLSGGAVVGVAALFCGAAATVWIEPRTAGWEPAIGSAVLLAIGSLVAARRGVLHEDPDSPSPWIGYRLAGIVAAWAGLYTMLRWPAVDTRDTLQLLTGVWFVAIAAEHAFADRRSLRPLTRLDPVGTDLSTASLANVVAAGGLAFILLQRSDPHTLGYLCLAAAAVIAVLGWVARHTNLAVIQLLQALVLACLAAPLLTDRYTTTLAWAALAMGVFVVAWLSERQYLRWMASGALLLATVHHFASGRGQVLWAHPALGAITTQLLTSWGLALLFHIAAWLKPGTSPRTAAPDGPSSAAMGDPVGPQASSASVELNYGVSPGWTWRNGLRSRSVLPLAWIGTFVAMIAGIGVLSPAGWIAAAIAWAALLAFVYRATRSADYGAQAAIVAVIASGFWVLQAVAQTADEWRRAPASVLDLSIVLGAVLIAGPGIWAWDRSCSTRGTGGRGGAFWLAAGLAAALAWFWVSIVTTRVAGTLLSAAEPAMAKQVGLSIVWGLLGLAGVIAGLRYNQRVTRIGGLGVLIVTLVKVFIVDLQEVDRIWRILSFVGLGIMLLVASFAYSRSRFAQAESAATGSDEP